MWEKLVTVLTAMLANYKQLLELSRCKRDILVTVQTKELEALTRQEELLIIKLGKLDQERQVVLTDIAAAYSVNREDLTIKKLGKMADLPVSAKIEALGEEFTQITQKLTDVNKLNTRLIQQSLDFVNYNLNILTQNCVGSTYQPKGQTGSQSRIVIDAKI